MKELEYVRSGLRVEMPGRVINYRILDVLEALDKRITSLRDDVNENASRIEEWADSTDIQLTVLESDRDNLQGRMHRQERPSPLLLDLVKRVCALDGGSDYEVHEKKPFSCCEGCAKYPCGHPPFQWLIPRGKTTPFECYREKKTCGECARAYRRDDSTRAICGSDYRWLDHSLDHECGTGDFEATP